VEEVQVPAPSRATKIPKSAPSRVTKKTKSIALVVEDNAELRQFIKQSIGADWQVIEASNGAEGVEKALELLPDIVISDVMMPMVDELKNNELTAHIPIILLTAKSGIESRLKGLRRGADDYLTKPFSTEELLARMENLVETRRKLRQLFGARAMELANLPETSPSVEKADNLLSEPDRAFLRRFAVLVEEKLGDERISVEDFAAKMLVSRSQLYRKLEALTGQSAWVFVRNYRLDRAHAMLKNKEGRVSEIALRTGFGSEKHFSTVFKERFGVSPSQI
jgi:DNA-binding response OmpR family regulator